MSATRLPDFVIIGAAKSATTWLVRNLQRHPNVYIPWMEVHYFSRHYDKGTTWYQSHFAAVSPHQTVGERSNTYLSCPEAARRLKELLPAAKIIVQLRNPIARAYSDYCMHLRRGKVTSAIEDYLDVSRSSVLRFIQEGFYYEHLSRFLQYYPRENLGVLIYDDIGNAPDALLRRAYRHIGIDVQHGVPEPVIERVYDKDIPELHPKLQQLLRPVRPVLGPFLHRRSIRRIRSALGSVPEYPPLTPPLWDKLAALYKDDVARLSELVGFDLGFWLVSKKS